MSLTNSVFRYVREARENPAGAVSGESLARLEAAASVAFDGSFEARTSPVAPFTWMGRALLDPTQDNTNLITLHLGEPLLIVGINVSLLNVDPDPARFLPPIEAFDVGLQINRKEFLTSQAEDKQVIGQDRQIVPLGSIDAVIANRLLGLILMPDDPQFSYRFHWATDAATRAVKAYALTQISLAFFVRPLTQRDHQVRI